MIMVSDCVAFYGTIVNFRLVGQWGKLYQMHIYTVSGLRNLIPIYGQR